MREIKFRGKSLENKKWVYGDLMSNICGTRIVRYTETDNGAKKRADWEYIDVDPSTIGQFTGLTDSNGKEIYEGDIVKACSQGEHRICEVAWNEDTASFFLRNPAGPWYLSGAWGDESCEVIGNIHNNPSLIPNQPTAI